MSFDLDTAVQRAESILLGQGQFAQELLGHLAGVEPEGRDKFRADCPFCGAHAFLVTVTRDDWARCMACGTGDGWRKSCERYGLCDRGMGYARLVCERAGVELQLSPKVEAEYKAAERSTDVREAAYAIMQRDLWSERGAAQLHYLRDRESGRGLSDDEIRGMGFGAYVGFQDMLAELVHQGIGADDVKRAGLQTVTKGDDAPDGWYRYGETHTVALPCYNRIGRLTHFSVRSIESYKRKWIHSEGSRPSEHLFNVHAVRDQPRVLIAESPLCALRATFHGVPCVATAGASGLQQVHVEQLRAAGCGVAVLGLDVDQAGRSGNLRAIRLLAQHDIVAVVAEFPCKDPDETIGLEGPAQLLHCVENAISAAAWEGRDMLRGVDMSKPVQRDPLLVKAQQRHAELLNINPLQAEDFASAVAAASGLDGEGVRIAVTGEGHYARGRKLLADADRALEQRRPLEEVLGRHVQQMSELRDVSAPPSDPVWIEQAGRAVWQRFDSRMEVIREIDEKNRLLSGPVKLKYPAAYEGYHCGLSDLQRMTEGLKRGTKWVIGGRTSMGKTQLLCDFTREMAVEYNIPFGLFSLETDKETLYTRILLGSTYSNRTGVDRYRLRNPQIMTSEHHQLLAVARRKTDRAPIDIVDGVTTLAGILSGIRRMKKSGIDVIGIDYLQLIKGMSSGARYLDVAEATRELKLIALELELAIIELAQLNRATEARGPQRNTRPTLADFRESDSIAHDADVVLFPYRDSYYYQPKPGEVRAQRAPFDPEDAVIIVAKNKEGPLGDVPVRYIAELGRFLPAAA